MEVSWRQPAPTGSKWGLGCFDAMLGKSFPVTDGDLKGIGRLESYLVVDDGDAVLFVVHMDDEPLEVVLEEKP